MKVAVLTLTQKQELEGNLLQQDWFFNPVQDGNEPPNWVISTQEIDNNQNQEFSWITELPLIDWVKPEETL